MTAQDIIEFGIRDVILATGATWRGDGLGASHWQPIPGYDHPNVFTPNDLMAGNYPSGQVVIFDDDHYYMGSVLAELLVEAGCWVAIVTPAPLVSQWSSFTLEQERVQKHLVDLGIEIRSSHQLDEIYTHSVGLTDTVSGFWFQFPCDSVVLVTDREPNNQLYQALKPTLEDRRLDSLRVIGDAEAPHIIAQAVYAGHLAAREFDEPKVDGTPFRRERTSLD